MNECDSEDQQQEDDSQSLSDGLKEVIATCLKPMQIFCITGFLAGIAFTVPYYVQLSVLQGSICLLFAIVCAFTSFLNFGRVIDSDR